MSSKPSNQKRSCSRITQPDGLLPRIFRGFSMLLNGFGELPQQCYRDSGQELQCPMMNQWAERSMDLGGSSVHNNMYRDPSMMCYGRQYYTDQNHAQYYSPNYQYPVNHYVQAPFVPDLPCHQQQEWDYNTMCFNVDGQPCQYTNVMDLEDFMNNEKRKEKSRVAARCRRTKEMQIFSELTAALPAKKEEVDALDKASVMRLAISYLRVRDVVSMLPQPESDQPVLKNPKGLEEVSSELSYMKALDGFVLVLSQQGDIVYCSDNIADHLGVSQMEIMGQSVFEFSHPCDHDEVREALRSHSAGRRDFLLRLKCTLTSKGRNVHLKSASYKVIHVTGHMLAPIEDKETKLAESKTQTDVDDEKADVEIDKNSIKTGSLVAVGRPIPHPSNIEIPLDSKTFLTKHSLDMKFTYTDESLTKTLGFDPDELKGRSLYEYHHAADSASLIHQFKSLFSKGQCETGQYRFLAKCGGFAWVQTQATVITDKQQKPISIVCVNYVISGIECKDEVFAAHQVPHADLKPKVPPAAPVAAQSPMQTGITVDIPDGAIVGIIPPEEERPTPVTEFIFAPRKEEMNKGFLMFSQDDSLTMLKDEPEDLTHLAPTAGDACIPLENSPFELFDEFLNNNYCSLLNDDLADGSPVESLPGDSLLMSSPEPHETDSSCERSSLLTDLSLDPFDSARSDNDIDDGNSPFIPNDDIPVLEKAVMWGALPDNVSLAKPQPSEIQNTSPAPALQRLLAARPTGPPPQDLITNLYDQGLLPSRSIPSWETGVKRTIPKREEEPIAKRAKRSPSPAPTPTSSSPSTQSSSVLMNLLDNEQRLQQVRPKPPPEYQVIMQPEKPISQNPNIPSINSNFIRNNIIVRNNNNNIFLDNNKIYKSNNAVNNSSNIIRNNSNVINNNAILHFNNSNIRSNSPNIRNNNDINNMNSKMRNSNSNICNSGGSIINNNNNIHNNYPNNSKIHINNNIPVNSINFRLTNPIPMHYNDSSINNNKIPLGNRDFIVINNKNIPIPVMNILQNMPKNQLLRPNTPNYDVSRTDLPHCMSPLNINVGSSVYSLPSSPSTSYSPIMSPSPRDHLSPYATPQSMSPVGKYCPGSRLMSPVGGKCCDPYFSDKMQASPNYNFPHTKVDLLMPLSPEFSLNEIMQTNDLLTALDDVKLD